MPTKLEQTLLNRSKSSDEKEDDKIVENLKAFRPGDALGRHLSGVDHHPRMRPGLEGKARNENFGKDTNLSDEDAGKPVGQLGFADKSKDKLKQEYRDHLRKKPLDIQQEEQSRIIFGGDPDDPRWKEFNERKAKQNKK